MRTKKITKHLILGALILMTGNVVGQASVLGNVAAFSTDFLGWDGSVTNNFPLQVRHDGPYPIDFYTSGNFRARINKTVTYPSLNGFTNIPADGFMLLSPTTNLLSSAPFGPHSRLHLADGTNDTSPFGYRLWQRNGITFTGNGDQSYIGQKYEASDFTDMVIQWSDNPGFSKADRMRFIFTSEYIPGTLTGMNSLNGLEGMRLWPKDTNTIYVGIGDFSALGIDPQEQLDVLTGRLRLRELPTTLPNNNLTKVMMVDNNGVVKWREGNSFLCNSGWSLNGNNAVTAFNGNPCAPQNVDAVGIGTNLSGGAVAKFTVSTNTFATATVINSTTVTPNNKGVVVQVNGGQTTDMGLYVLANGTLPGNTTKTGASLDLLTGTSYRNLGVSSKTNGASFRAAAGEFISNDNASYTQGVDATVTNGVNQAFALSGKAQSSASVNCGLYTYQGPASPVLNPPVGNYGLFAGTIAPNYTTGWAGWFQGDVNVTGLGYIPGGVWNPSDENLKSNVTDLPNALEVVLQLHPKSYNYQLDEFPQLGLPAGQQYGFLAQELEQVIPESVKDITFQATLDSTGQETFPAVSSKMVNTAMVIPFLVAAVKEQQATIAQMQEQINNCCAAQGQGMAPNNGDQRIAPAEELKEQRLLIIPNPVADLTTLRYYVPQAGKVSLQVSSADGKPMETLREEKAEAGEFNYTWNTTQLAAGTYFCTLMVDGNVVVKRAVKVK